MKTKEQAGDGDAERRERWWGLAGSAPGPAAASPQGLDMSAEG